MNNKRKTVSAIGYTKLPKGWSFIYKPHLTCEIWKGGGKLTSADMKAAKAWGKENGLKLRDVFADEVFFDNPEIVKRCRDRIRDLRGNLMEFFRSYPDYIEDETACRIASDIRALSLIHI